MPAPSSASQHAAGRPRRARGARRRPRRCSPCRRRSPSAPPDVGDGRDLEARHRPRPPARPRASSSRAAGPCTASTARVSVTSATVHSPAPWATAASSSASTSGAVFDALGITRKSPGATHHTMMSSTTCASSGSSRCVYCACAGADAIEIVGERPLQRGERTRTVHAHRPEVRHVEHHAHARGTHGAPRARSRTGSASPTRRTRPCARRARGARRRAGCRAASRRSRSRRLGARRGGAGGREVERERRRARRRRVRRTSCDGGSSPYFTSRCR